MTQYYIFEIQQYADGSYGDIRHIAYDEDATMARLKAESKYHEVLAAAAISTLPLHSATLLTSDGRVVMNQSYKHAQPEPSDDSGDEPTEPIEE